MSFGPSEILRSTLALAVEHFGAHFLRFLLMRMYCICSSMIFRIVHFLRRLFNFRWPAMLAEQPDDTESSTAAERVPATTSSSSATGVSLLYPHALQSIFAFVSLSELAQLMAVSRDWQANVLRTKGANCQLLPIAAQKQALRAAMASRLRSLVTSVGSGECDEYIGCDGGLAAELVDRFPQLRALHVEIQSIPYPILQLPQHLRELTLLLKAGSIAAYLNASLEAAAAQLHELTFLRVNTGDDVSFASLRHMLQLRCLILIGRSLNDLQCQQLRQLSQLEELRPPNNCTLAMQRLLAPGHVLRLHTLTLVSIHACVTLTTLPTLTHLRMHYSSLDKADCLLALPRLRTVELADDGEDAFGWRELMTVLPRCPYLEELTFDGCTIGPLLISCCSSCPHLLSLTFNMCAQFPSLQCLRAGSLPTTLTALRLQDIYPKLRVQEFVHLRALRSLRSVRLIRALERRLSPTERALYQPPSALMPALQHFSC